MRMRTDARVAVVAALLTALAWGETRTMDAATYRDRVHGAWLGQIIGAIFGWPFEGKPRNVMMLDHYLKGYDYAPVDDDYYYEMVALYGFERHGTGMTVEQLGEMWKEHQAGSWGSSEQARLALERGIQAPETGSPRYNRWFHTIGPQFSADIYGMIAPGMVNLAGKLAREYSHVNGYAEGSDGAVFVAACVSEAFFESRVDRVVRQAAQLIHPGSNYRKALDQVLAGYDAGIPWKQLARDTEARWRADYPQMNNAVANGALVAIALLYGNGNYLDSINIVTQAGDFTDADCNAANVGSVLGAMHGLRALPKRMIEPLRDRIYGTSMGPVQFRKAVDEKISDLAERIAVTGEQMVKANGGRVTDGRLSMPRQKVETQALEQFDVNGYAAMWNRRWRMEAAGRGGTYLDGETLVTLPRDTRPVRLEGEFTLKERRPGLKAMVRAEAGKPWRLDIFVDDERVATKVIEGDAEVTVALDTFAGRNVLVRLYQFQMEGRAAAQAYWRSVEVE